MKYDITSGVHDFFTTWKMPPGVNEMSIVLLPKKMIQSCSQILG
jgi:hypothetical protein